MSDPKRQFAVEVVERLKAAGYEALWAGGCVRDFLRGRPAKDYDVATNARPDEVRTLFGQRRTHAVGASFGVILVRGPTRETGDVEVATFRHDVDYVDGRRPTQVVFTTAEEDAKRRDFTINGMFYDPVAQRVIDYVGGEHDLAAGVLRAIGEPQARMREDKLRMLRAVRFAAALEFELDPRTADAIRDMVAEIHVVSAERIAQELRRMLVDRHRRRAMELAHGVGLLSQIVPELRPILGSHSSDLWSRTLHMLQLLPKPGFELSMAVLLHTLGPESADVPAADPHAVAKICRRLRLSNDESERIVWFVAQQRALDGAREFSAARLKRLLAQPGIADLLELVRVLKLASDADLSDYAYCEEYLLRTPAEEINPPPLITGDDLIRRGMRPGPRFKELLEMVRDAQLNGEIVTAEEAMQLAQSLGHDFDIRAMGEACRIASEDLGIGAMAPFILEVADAPPEEFIACFPRFGTKIGTLVCHFRDWPLKKEIAEQHGYNCSGFHPESYSRYDRRQFIEAFNEWGWMGSPSERPSWCLG